MSEPCPASSFIRVLEYEHDAAVLFNINILSVKPSSFYCISGVPVDYSSSFYCISGVPVDYSSSFYYISGVPVDYSSSFYCISGVPVDCSL